MTKGDTIKLITLISALYPRDVAFARATPEMVGVWHKMLEDIPYDLAEGAVQAHAANSPFPPSISEIRGWGADITSPVLGANDAWGLASAAMRKYGYTDPAGARAALPPDVWQVCQQFGWMDMCACETIEVLRGQFLRQWEALVVRKRKAVVLPPSVNAMILQLSDKLGGDQARIEGSKEAR
jgi:hypothetical protein